jgi:hypothetical protein
MWRACGQSIIALGLALGSLLGSGAQHIGTRTPSFVIATPDQVGPLHTDGQFVVWTARPNGAARMTIYAASLGDRQVVPVATDLPDDPAPDLEGGIVVWQASRPGSPSGDRDIRAKDLASNREFTVVATAADEAHPFISGGWIVWMQPDGAGPAATRALMGRPLDSMGMPVKLASLDGTLRGIRIEATQMTWVEEQIVPSGTTYRLRSLKLGDTVPRGYGGGTAVPGTSYAVGIDSLVVGSPVDGQLTIFRLGIGSQVVTYGMSGAGVASDGRYIVWAEGQPGPGSPEKRTQLVAYDLFTFIGSAFTIASTGTNDSPAIAGGVVVWRRAGPGGSEIHMVRLADTVPSARRPAPAGPSPDQLYFPETGHSLAFGFRAFWEQNGGLPVFGYPLTEEFGQSPRDLPTRDDAQLSLYGARRTVQYLERQRFEYHPEHAGTPYAVQLGRLGVEDAQRRFFSLITPPFAPVPARSTGGPQCIFFAETGHNLCSGFRAYWQSHGLEFGDPGVSYRESLALFGYPISEEFTDPETGLSVQYFERARFEYHPENPDRHRVLLSQLGAARLAELGW